MLPVLRTKITGEQFETYAAVILRIPGLLLLDYWWQFDRKYSIPKSLEWSDIVSAVFTNIVVLQGILLLVLPLEQLVAMYMHYISGTLITLADLFSRHYVQAEQTIAKEMSLETTDSWSLLQNDHEHVFLKRQLSAIVVHAVIASSVSFLLDIDCNLKRAGLAAYCIPVVARLANFPISELSLIHNFTSAFIILMSIYYNLSLIPGILQYVKNEYEKTMVKIQIYGGVHFCTNGFFKLFAPTHFVLYWLVLFVLQVYNYFITEKSDGLIGDQWYIVLLWIISQICCSPLSLFGAAFTVSCASKLILQGTKIFIEGREALVNEHLLHAGVGEGMTMILLALQTSLISLKMPHRMGAMSVVLFIVAGSLIQSMYEITEPVLLALSASQTKLWHKHARLLLLCFFLCFFPLYMIYMLYHVFDLDFWTVVVISTCALTSVQVIGLLIIYTLFMYDAKQTEPWEALDDVVYYARSVTRVLEFLVALFVVSAGVHDSFLSNWSWMNSSILGIHCYYNVWLRVQSGWRSFLLRKEAVRKIKSLPEATQSQLKENNDVCSICYSDMKTARITPCKHFFHASCLRKWLYIQEKCPLCVNKITITERSPSEDIPNSADNNLTNTFLAESIQEEATEL